jgi:hypothetical protein
MCSAASRSSRCSKFGETRLPESALQCVDSAVNNRISLINRLLCGGANTYSVTEAADEAGSVPCATDGQPAAMVASTPRV